MWGWLKNYGENSVENFELPPIFQIIYLYFSGGLQAVLNVSDCGKDINNVTEGYDKYIRYGPGKTYYIASEEVMWDYAPSGQDQVFSSRKPRYRDIIIVNL